MEVEVAEVVAAAPTAAAVAEVAVVASVAAVAAAVLTVASVAAYDKDNDDDNYATRDLTTDYRTEIKTLNQMDSSVFSRLSMQQR